MTKSASEPSSVYTPRSVSDVSSHNYFRGVLDLDGWMCMTRCSNTILLTKTSQTHTRIIYCKSRANVCVLFLFCVPPNNARFYIYVYSFTRLAVKRVADMDNEEISWKSPNRIKRRLHRRQRLYFWILSGNRNFPMTPVSFPFSEYKAPFIKIFVILR